MSRKNVLLPFHFLQDVQLQASFQSDPTFIQYLDNVGIQLKWTADAEGEFFVEGSINYDPKHPEDAIWDRLPLNPSMVVDTDPDSALIDLNQLSFPYIRVAFESTFVGSLVETIADNSTFGEFDIVADDTAGSTQGDFFTFTAPNGDTYAVYLNINGAGVEPTADEYLNADVQLTADIITAGTADDTATAIATALGTIPDLTITVLTDTVTILYDVVGPIVAPDTFNEDASGSGSLVATLTAPGTMGLAGKYFTIDNAIAGQKYAVYFVIDGVTTVPSITGFTNIPVDINHLATNSQVATAIAAELEGLEGISSVDVNTNEVSFTLSNNQSDIDAETSGFTVTNNTIDAVVNGYISAKMI